MLSGLCGSAHAQHEIEPQELVRATGVGRLAANQGNRAQAGPAHEEVEQIHADRRDQTRHGESRPALVTSFKAERPHTVIRFRPSRVEPPRETDPREDRALEERRWPSNT